MHEVHEKQTHKGSLDCGDREGHNHIHHGRAPIDVGCSDGDECENQQSGKHSDIDLGRVLVVIVRVCVGVSVGMCAHVVVLADEIKQRE